MYFSKFSNYFQKEIPNIFQKIFENIFQKTSEICLKNFPKKIQNFSKHLPKFSQ